MTAAGSIVSDVLAIGVPVAAIVWLLRHRRDYLATSDLTRRGNVIARGIVEADSAPVTIAYKQWRCKGGWEEQARTIHGTPFVLRTADVQIQVDPDEDDVSLLWDPDHAERDREFDSLRIHRAILEPGATVEIFGNFRPAPTGGDPYRDPAVLPMLVPSRAERLMISKRPIAPKLDAMRRYLARRACMLGALTVVLHVAVDTVWRADVSQLGIETPSDAVRVWIGFAFAALAYYCARTKRPWRVGKCNQSA
jgi:hypothetical protein